MNDNDDDNEEKTNNNKNKRDKMETADSLVMATIVARRVLGQGMHITLQTKVKVSRLANVCDNARILLLESLPHSTFVDQFQLSSLEVKKKKIIIVSLWKFIIYFRQKKKKKKKNKIMQEFDEKRARAQVFESLDLECPEFAPKAKPYSVVLSIDNVDLKRRRRSPLLFELPVHARYAQPLPNNDTHHQTVMFHQPLLFAQCLDDNTFWRLPVKKHVDPGVLSLTHTILCFFF